MPELMSHWSSAASVCWEVWVKSAGSSRYRASLTPWCRFISSWSRCLPRLLLEGFLARILDDVGFVAAAMRSTHDSLAFRRVTNGGRSTHFKGDTISPRLCRSLWKDLGPTLRPLFTVAFFFGDPAREGFVCKLGGRGGGYSCFSKVLRRCCLPRQDPVHLQFTGSSPSALTNNIKRLPASALSVVLSQVVNNWPDDRARRLAGSDVMPPERRRWGFQAIAGPAPRTRGGQC